MSSNAGDKRFAPESGASTRSGIPLPWFGNWWRGSHEITIIVTTYCKYITANQQLIDRTSALLWVCTPTMYLMPMYSIYLFNTFPNIESPFLDDSVVRVLLMKLGKNINGSRECSTTFLNGNDSITHRACFPSKDGLHLFTECANLITSFLEGVRI
ncbi:hypothetical protein BGY98DRAFT_1164823 [Russula aff. rugulosa BPL654]|nr:hypothetical protein BGY98DRAFT_1164823 [Russula aff. rugulosa BPL654]